MSSHCAAQAPIRLRPLFAAAFTALSLTACGSSSPLASAAPSPTPDVDEPQTPVMRCAPPLADASAQLVQVDCVAPAAERAS